MGRYEGRERAMLSVFPTNRKNDFRSLFHAEKHTRSMLDVLICSPLGLVCCSQSQRTGRYRRVKRGFDGLNVEKGAKANVMLKWADLFGQALFVGPERRKKKFVVLWNGLSTFLLATVFTQKSQSRQTRDNTHDGFVRLNPVQNHATFLCFYGLIYLPNDDFSPLIFHT